jgi:hypothetical protein
MVKTSEQGVRNMKDREKEDGLNLTNPIDIAMNRIKPYLMQTRLSAFVSKWRVTQND